MFPNRQRIDCIEALLPELDALAEGCADAAREDLEDLNAELEDILMLLRELKPEDMDDAEEFADALEDVRALAGDYRRLSGDIPELGALAEKLAMICEPDAPNN